MVFSSISRGIRQRRIRIATFVVSVETLSLEKKQHLIGGHLLLPKSLNQGFLAQQRSRRSSRGLSSLWNCAHTAETIVRQPACFDFLPRAAPQILSRGSRCRASWLRDSVRWRRERGWCWWWRRWGAAGCTPAREWAAPKTFSPLKFLTKIIYTYTHLLPLFCLTRPLFDASFMTTYDILKSRTLISNSLDKSY